MRWYMIPFMKECLSTPLTIDEAVDRLSRDVPRKLSWADWLGIGPNEPPQYVGKVTRQGFRIKQSFTISFQLLGPIIFGKFYCKDDKLFINISSTLDPAHILSLMICFTIAIILLVRGIGNIIKPHSETHPYIFIAIAIVIIAVNYTAAIIIYNLGVIKAMRFLKSRLCDE